MSPVAVATARRHLDHLVGLMERRRYWQTAWSLAFVCGNDAAMDRAEKMMDRFERCIALANEAQARRESATQPGPTGEGNGTER